YRLAGDQTPRGMVAELALARAMTQASQRVLEFIAAPAKGCEAARQIDNTGAQAAGCSEGWRYAAGHVGRVATQEFVSAVAGERDFEVLPRCLEKHVASDG